MFRSLKVIQAEQKAAGLIARPDNDEGFSPNYDESTPARELLYAPEIPASPQLRAISNVAGGGYCRLLPPTAISITALEPEWVAENWGTIPSPWCRVEGLPDHPEFAVNLKAFQDAQ